MSWFGFGKSKQKVSDDETRYLQIQLNQAASKANDAENADQAIAKIWKRYGFDTPLSEADRAVAMQQFNIAINRMKEIDKILRDAIKHIETQIPMHISQAASLSTTMKFKSP